MEAGFKYVKTTVPNESSIPDNGTMDIDANHAPFKRHHQARLMAGVILGEI